jgi:hypothetical protein
MWVLIKLPVAHYLVKVMVWGDGIYLGEKKGNHNTQQELLPIDMTAHQLVGKFTKLLQTCIPYYQNSYWI